MSVTIGGATIGSKYVKKNQWRLKDGESTYRILPSLGFNGQKPNNRWAEFYKVHFGYKNTKGEMRVFQSSFVKNYKTKMVEQTDAAFDRITELKLKLEEAKKAGNKSLVEKLSKFVGGDRPMYNLDSNWHVNAIDEQGNIGILKLRKRAMDALELVINALKEKGINPLSAEDGRFFVFRRSGMGLDTTFSVTVKTRTLQVPGVGEVEQPIIHKITQELADRLEAEAGDLGNLYKRLSSEQIAKIVEHSDLLTGKSVGIDEAFDKEASEENGEGDSSISNLSGGLAVGNKTSTPIPTAAIPTVRASTLPNGVTGSGIYSTPLPSSTPPAVSVTSNNQTGGITTANTSIAEMSDADFLASLEM